ncbi:MAG: glycosyltransferase [Chitinivibrionales bacterium]|nr:glycosyltransferase [Chitinivibrionales bacterium]MBD3394901.1 glycosyltransferase [Chitinivibrionales bacterium]
MAPTHRKSGKRRTRFWYSIFIGCFFPARSQSSFPWKSILYDISEGIHAVTVRGVFPPRAMKNVLVDCRELRSGTKTGIGRFLEAMIAAAARRCDTVRFILAYRHGSPVSPKHCGRENAVIRELPADLVRSERALSRLSREGPQLFISPYPKLPLFGCGCPAIHTIHDILDLTHAAYRRRPRTCFDRRRLKQALRTGALTWYDSAWSLEETRRHIGFAGRRPVVRRLAVDDAFSPVNTGHDLDVVRTYGLVPGYVLLIGNGLPHKNIGVMLAVADRLKRNIVCVGVPAANRGYWNRMHPPATVQWIDHVVPEHLAPVVRGAFCLAQPSTEEGYGYPPLEAMACGTPAIVSSIPVLRETTGGSCMEADPGDPTAWLDAIHTLEDATVRQQRIEQGFAFVGPLRGDTGWQGHIDDILSVLDAR